MHGGGVLARHSIRLVACASRLSALVCRSTWETERMSYETLSEAEWEAVERVWDLLDEGKIENARAGIDALLDARPGHPDLRIADAAVALDEDEAERALIALQGAESSADPSL